MKYIQLILLVLITSLSPLEDVYSAEGDIKKCNCKSLLITSDDEAAGCTADIKMEVCEQYRQMQIFIQNENLREQARRFHDDANAVRIERSRRYSTQKEPVLILK